MSYHWHVAQDKDYSEIYSFLLKSKVRDQWTADDVKRRVMIPLFLYQLVIFRNDEDVMCGFLTIAFMSDESAAHQDTIGVQNEDWRSGKQLWVVDFVANDGGGARMLRTIEKSLDTERYGEVRYWRFKYLQKREVRV